MCFDYFVSYSAELTRLWNICGDNLDACRSSKRDFTPPIDAFFAEAFKEVEVDPPPLDLKKEVTPKKYEWIYVFLNQALQQIIILPTWTTTKIN